mmetsp:Transcript_50942/g.91594  ORF Transcript_50942/g.91594 Transcript_50942/m.91594 type:complete len:223 (+) Transcript_50942:3-671(+)
MEVDGQQVLDAIGHHVGQSVRCMLLDLLHRGAKHAPRPGDAESGNFPRGLSVLDAGQPWSHWEQSYPSMPYMEDQQMARCEWDAYGWGADGYGSIFPQFHSSAWSPAPRAYHPWSPPIWGEGWSSGRGADLALESALNLSPEATKLGAPGMPPPLDFEDPLTPALRHAKAVEDEFTPATTAGRSSGCGSAVEEAYGDDLLQKVLFGESRPISDVNLDIPPGL